LTKKFLALLVVILCQGCATKTPYTDKLASDFSGLPRASQIETIPFIQQEAYYCGPASLAMILESNKRPVHMDTLVSQMITPEQRGAFSTDIISAVRRQGMIPIRINDLNSLLKEIAMGQPVLVFQNLGFRWYPQWHYAVALGYDLSGPDIILHSGDQKYLKSDMRMFERSWTLANSWGLIVLTPGDLVVTVDDLGHVAGISGLERLGKYDEAKISYAAVLKKWPQSLAALIAMANVLYAKGDFKGSAEFLSEATKFHPISETAWHNLAIAQGANGELDKAKTSAHHALSLVKDDQSIVYQKSLDQWLVHHY
jgi:tetratricopeptide (TPR) repeat protein